MRQNDYLQVQITQWARDVFGPSSNARLFNRCSDEFMELKDAIYNSGKQEDIADECADVLHFLFQIAEQNNFDLIRATSNKFDKNIERNWSVSGDGTGKHIE